MENKKQVATCCGGLSLDEGERCPVCGERYEDEQVNQKKRR